MFKCIQCDDLVTVEHVQMQLVSSLDLVNRLFVGTNLHMKL